MRQAPHEEIPDRLQADPFGEEALFPETAVPSDNCLRAVLVDEGVFLTDILQVLSVRVGTDNTVLVVEGDPVIRDDGGKQQGVCPSALRAFDPADAEEGDTFRQENTSFVIAMDGKAPGGSAGTPNLVHLEAVNGRIVVIL
jgi:hypothetical protein